MPSNALQTIEAAAMQLSIDERAELVEHLLATILPPVQLHPEWEAEVARRVADLDAGRVQMQPADHVLAEVRERIATYQAKR